MKNWFRKNKQSEKVVIHEIDFSKENQQAQANSQQTSPNPAPKVEQPAEPIGKTRKKPAESSTAKTTDQPRTAKTAEGFGLKNLFSWRKKAKPEQNSTTSPRPEPSVGDVVQPLRLKWWYVLSVFGVLALVFFSAYVVVRQVYDYRKDLKVYNELMREHEQAKIEWGRLIIEQQTFGATAQIGTRAVTQLKMYSPPISETVVIASEKTTTKSNQP